MSDKVKKELTVVRCKCTKLTNVLTSTVIDGLDFNESEVNLFKLEDCMKRINDLDRLYFDECMDSLSSNELIKIEVENDQYTDKLQLCISKVKSNIAYLNSLNTSTSGQQQGVAHSFMRTKLQLPNITLPIFSADPEIDQFTCQSFINSLEHLTKAYHLNDIEMFSILEKQTEKRANAMINSLTLSNRSYDTAKTILLSSFAEVTPQKHAIIKQFTNLKLKPDSDPYIFYAQFLKLLVMNDEQKIDLNDWHQYFIWNALSPSFQDTLISISKKTFPDLNEIKSNFINASSRFLGQKSKKRRDEIEMSTHISNVDTEEVILANATALKINSSSNKEKQICCFCSSKEHSNSKCDKFVSVTSKKSRILELNLCYKCLRKGHMQSACSFKLKSPCFKCNGKHWSFMCFESQKRPESKTEASASRSDVTELENNLPDDDFTK